MFDYGCAFLTAREAGNFLKVSTNYVYFLLHTGVLPGIRVGYFWRIPTPALNQFIMNQLHHPQP